jgi:DNA-binding response OmpR family regulator
MSRVLIVEDDPDVVALVRRWLERDGHQVEHAADGAAAVQALKGGALPQLVLLDVMLPKMDGFEVLRQIRAEPLTNKLPVVMVTSFSRDRDAARGRELGANDYVVKPLMEVDFMKRVASLLRVSKA